MTRYAAFAFAKYYPNGGWDDLVGLHDGPADTFAPLRNWYANEKAVTGAYWQIVDLQTRQVIQEGEFDDRGNPVIGEAP